MSPALKTTLGASLVASAIGYLAYIGAATSWQYYVSVAEVRADAANLLGKRIRVSGRVAKDSLTIVEGRRRAFFELSGKPANLRVTCRCALPDNLTDDMDIVVEGTLKADGVHGTRVITRCASKYQPATAKNASDSMPGKPAA